MSVLSDFAFQFLNMCNFILHNYGYNLLLIIVIYVYWGTFLGGSIVSVVFRWG